MKTFSSYQIHWVEFFPTTKCNVSKHDQKVFGAISVFEKQSTYKKHFPSKQAAIDYLRNFNSAIDDRYRCRIFTDKQFGMAKEEEGYAIPYTKKQAKEEYFIG